MSDAKKERKMTPRGFLHKASKQGVRSAEGFIAQHRAWLETGTLAQFTSPILAKLDRKEVYPTPALEQLSSAVLSHHLMAETAQEEVKQDQQVRETGTSSGKAWLATIYDAAGHVCTRINAKGEEEDLIKSFDMSLDADRWCDRRLFDGASDWYGVVQSTRMVNGQGDPIANVILRQDAMARILKMPKGAITRKTGGGSGRLSFGIKNGKTTRVEFSRG